MAATDGRAKKPRTSVWLADRPPAKRKADQPAALDLDKIVEATVRLLDSEGLTKFSMRRLAAELGVTAMSVYWYVETKDDLLELALDAAMGEMSLPQEAASREEWPAHLRALAYEYRTVLTGHPWVAQLLGRFINIGPHALAFANATHRMMISSGLPMEQIAGALSSVFQFVYGFATIEALFNARCKEAGVNVDAYFQQVMSAVNDKPAVAQDLEFAAQFMAARGAETVREMRDRDFCVAIDVQIKGIEAMRDQLGAQGEAAAQD